MFLRVITRNSLRFGEDLLLRIMEIINTSGSGLAHPSQTLYLGRDSGLDKDKTESVHREVQKWRESGNLPFPDFEANRYFRVQQFAALSAARVGGPASKK